MKFWQMTSIFRDETKILEDELKSERWSFYYDTYKNLEVIVRQQKRDLLDMEVDGALVKNICLKSKKIIYYSSKRNIIYSYETVDADKEIAISDAIDIFDHDAIEETFEKSYSEARFR